MTAQTCDLCGGPHRRDLSGPRCFLCRLEHGPAPIVRDPRIVRVDPPAGGENTRMRAEDWADGA